MSHITGAAEGCTVHRNTGGYFDFLNPHLTPPNIIDIARGLSNTCRYGGQSTRFYSVAEHSVLMSYAVPREHAYAALMHDSAEAFICDMPKPLKEELPDYKIVEERVERAFSYIFDIPYPLPDIIKQVDLQMLVIEKEDLLKNFDPWRWTVGIERPKGIELQFWSPEHAFARFLNRYDCLIMDAAA